MPSQTSWVRLSAPGDAPRLLVVAEATVEGGVERLVQRLLAGVAERRVTRVVAEPDRLHEVFVEPERPRDDARDRGRLERMGHPGSIVVAIRVDEDLGLSLQPPERLRVNETITIALERRAHGARRLASALPRVSNEGTASGESHASS